MREYIGTYPGLRLADAREKATQRKALVGQGVSPDAASVLLEEQSDMRTTVGDLYDVWYEKHVLRNRSSESDKASIKSRFENYVKPKVGDIPPGQDSPRPADDGYRRSARSQ